jgi:hypothetical protein
MLLPLSMVEGRVRFYMTALPGAQLVRRFRYLVVNRRRRLTVQFVEE